MHSVQNRYSPEHLEELLHQWFLTERGQRLFESEKSLILQLLNRKLTMNLAQLDAGSYRPLFEPKHAGCGCLITRLNNQAPCPLIRADGRQLPLLPASIDVFVNYHYLDFCKNPRTVLRQMDVSLSDSGTMIMVGVNPWSLAKNFRREVAFSGRQLTRKKMVDWLKVLGYDIEDVFWIKQTRPILWRKPQNWLLNQFFSWFEGLNSSYVVVARKQVYAGIAPRKFRLNHKTVMSAMGKTRTSLKAQNKHQDNNETDLSLD
jgi:hypothetical protein